MHAPGTIPPYPPERDAWRFPPPPVSRSWLLAALLAPLLALTIAIGAVVVIGQAEGRDARGFLDGELSSAVVARECGLMTGTVKGLRAAGPPEVRAAILADQNKAVRTMLQRIGEMPPAVRASDRPLEAWLADWQSLLSARERWTEAVERGFTGGFAVPRDDSGALVTRRMDAAAEDICEVPEALLDPYAVEDLEV